MNPYRKFYAEVLRCSSFDGERRFCHKIAGSTPINLGGELYGEKWIALAEEAAWPTLYRLHYLCARQKILDGDGNLTMRDMEDAEFVGHLSEVNRSPGILDHGWIVCGVEGSEYICKKGGVRLRASTASLQFAQSDPQATPTVSVRLPAERRYWMPMYYCTAGGTASQIELRIYFNIKPSRAAWLLLRVSQGLLETDAGYQLKILNNPLYYIRPDAAVLYVPASAIDICRALVRRLIAEDSSAFRSAVPALTKRLHPGIAVAAEPITTSFRKVSFGEHRCRIVARGLARAHCSGRRSESEAVEMICREFARENLDASRPYANAGDEDVAHKF